MKSNISDRPMFKKGVDDSDVENVGIMQGFMDEMEAEDEMEDDEDYQTEKMLDRRPNSPEILMNNLRGDMRSIDARVEELADLVGYNAAADTPQDVLALLQPVLAQQSAPMPPQGGIPAAMPQGAPAMPQGMPEMPPEAAMGGIGALPMDQGSGMEAPPVAMANGGYVQSFRDGSDEDGVTPTGDSSSFAGVFSPDIVGAAQQQVLRSLGQQPLAVPDLATEVDKRTPLYEKLLGVDPAQSQAQILFELGQRAFNYGANVDDQGRALTGSQASRLAGAVRTLPTAMGQITSQLEQQKRGVRTAALQASEKDVQNIRERNAKLVETQTKLWQEIAKSTKDKGFGTGTEGVAWTTLTNLAPDYAAGTLPENQVRKFETAYAIVSTPTQFTDEYGRIVTKEARIPDFIKSAISSRDTLSTVTPKVSPPLATWTGTELSTEDLAALKTEAEKGSPDAISALEAYSQRAITQKPTAEAVVPQKQVGVPPPAPKEPAKTLSLWDIAESYSGPAASVKSGITAVPSLGGSSPDVTRARSYGSSAINQIVSALGTTARFGNTEREQIKEELGLVPSALQDPMKFRERLVGLDSLLTEEISNAKRIINSKDVPVELQKEAERSLAELTNAKKFVNIPTATSEEDAKRYPVGSFVLYKGKILQRKFTD